MHDETEERMRKDRDTTKRAECFARLVLSDREDHEGRKLLNYAERTTDRLPMQWEKTIAWLSLALRTDGVDDSTLTGLGFDCQDVRHATVVRPRENETAMAYAERLAAYDQPEAFAVGEAMLNETAYTNSTVPAGTTNTARDAAIDRLRSAQKEWAEGRRGGQARGQARGRPPAGGVADERPTAPGLADAVRRLEHHVQMVGLCLNEMQRGPGGTPWGIAERLSLDDLHSFLNSASLLTFNAGAIVVETANLTTTPATGKERATLAASREPDTPHIAGIAAVAATIYEVATRLQTEIVLPEDDDKSIH